MEIKIIQENENALFKRKEIKGSVVSESTPTRLDVSEFLSKKFSVPLEAIKIKGIQGRFGSNEFKIEANIYPSKGDRDSVELKKKKDVESEKKLAEANVKKEEIIETEKPAEPSNESQQEEPKQESSQETQAEENKQEEVKE